MGTTLQFRDELTKYLSATKTCDNAALTDCFPATIKDINGNTVTVPTTTVTSSQSQFTFSDNAVGLILNNGTTMSLVYNKNCSENTVAYDVNNSYGQNHVCANFVFDTNGKSGPNQVGKDIGFATVINPTNTVTTGVIPDTSDLTNANWQNAMANCNAKGDTWHLPTKDELNSLYYNKTIIGNLAGGGNIYWSSVEYAPDPTSAWDLIPNTGFQYNDDKSINLRVRCVRR
jgi:maltose-binding protein MalE